jgi:hypothetical protein
VIRTIACSLLLAIGVSIVAPALTPAPAYAATVDSARIETGPSVPWQKVGQWILRNALTLLMLAEEILRGLQGGEDNPPPPETPPSPALAEAV